MVTVLLLALGLAAPCEEAIEAATLEARAVEAEQAWADMESERFVEQATALREQLPCVTDALYPDQVAAWFRVQGMFQFYEGDREGAVQALDAAFAIDPDWTLPGDLAGPDHPLHELVRDASVRPTRWKEVAAPAEGWLRIDGATGDLIAPVGRPWVFQRFEADGTLAVTFPVAADGLVPTYRVATPSSLASDQRMRRLRRIQALGVAATWSGPVLLLGGAATQFGPGPSAVGGVVAVVGLSGMVAGIPITNVATARERALLSEHGLAVRGRSVGYSWAFYGLNLGAVAGTAVVASLERGGFGGVTVAFVGVLCWPVSAIFSTAAVGDNRRLTRAEPRRARVHFGVLPASQGTQFGLVVHGW